jgi:hypothetical protein
VTQQARQARGEASAQRWSDRRKIIALSGADRLQQTEARRTPENPPFLASVSRSRRSSACAPSAGPFLATETGTRTIVDAP